MWRLDRLAGTQPLAIDSINHLHDRGVHIKSLTEPDIDTTTPMGRALFGIVAVFAQLRVDTISEDTRAGLARARAEGRIGGRPTVMTPERIREALRMRTEGQSLDTIAATLGVGRSSVSRALDRLSRLDKNTTDTSSVSGTPSSPDPNSPTQRRHDRGRNRTQA